MSTQYRYAKPADADLRRVERRNDPQRRYAQRTIRRRHREKDNVRTRLQFLTLSAKAGGQQQRQQALKEGHNRLVISRQKSTNAPTFAGGCLRDGW
jgi:hypothetical protein